MNNKKYDHIIVKFIHIFLTKEIKLVTFVLVKKFYETKSKMNQRSTFLNYHFMIGIILNNNILQ